MAHIDLTREADAVLVAPASADFIAKLAHGPRRRTAQPAVPGAADRTLPAAAGTGDEPRDVGPPGDAAQCWRRPWPTAPVLLGPAAATRPAARSATGACSKPTELCEELIAFFQPKRLAGQRVLITAGPTFEAIDPVRGITNLSSGKMGFAIARAAARSRRAR